jgi:NADPH2:quinone reductase
VSIGNASGPVAIPNLVVLARKGSLYLTRPSTDAYFTSGEQRRAAGAAQFAGIGSGRVKVAIDQRFPLSEVAAAHAALEARRTTGSTVILP